MFVTVIARLNGCLAILGGSTRDVLLHWDGAVFRTDWHSFLPTNRIDSCLQYQSTWAYPNQSTFDEKFVEGQEIKSLEIPRSGDVGDGSIWQEDGSDGIIDIVLNGAEIVVGEWVPIGVMEQSVTEVCCKLRDVALQAWAWSVLFLFPLSFSKKLPCSLRDSSGLT
jgi:hypothetical protein